MYRLVSAILFLLLMSIGFIRYHFPIVAQDSEYDCRRDLNIFLFEYNHPLWQEYAEIIEATACDIHHFWMQVDGLPSEYQPPNYIVQEYASFPFTTPDNFTERTQNGACSIRPSFANAGGYYCTSPYGIVVSEPNKFLNYFDWEHNQRGKLTIPLLLAHEWAHHIQLSVLNDRDMPELQAECFVGSYFRFAVSNPNLTLVGLSQEEWDALMQVVPTDSNERAGNLERWADISVGERGLALRMGYQGGIDSCLSNW